MNRELTQLTWLLRIMLSLLILTVATSIVYAQAMNDTAPPANMLYVFLLGLINVLLLIVGFFAKRSLDEVKEIRYEVVGIKDSIHKLDRRVVRIETKLNIDDV